MPRPSPPPELRERKWKVLPKELKHAVISDLACTDPQYTYKQIAQRRGVAVTTISTIARQAKLQRYAGKASVAQIAEVAVAGVQGRLAKEIALELGLSRDEVRRILREGHIEELRRRTKDAILLSMLPETVEQIKAKVDAGDDKWLERILHILGDILPVEGEVKNGGGTTNVLALFGQETIARLTGARPQGDDQPAVLDGTVRKNFGRTGHAEPLQALPAAPVLPRPEPSMEQRRDTDDRKVADGNVLVVGSGPQPSPSDDPPSDASAADSAGRDEVAGAAEVLLDAV